jgi:TatD DNase family protein
VSGSLDPRAAPALYDSHCHLDYEAFDLDRDAVIERAKAAGVERIVIPGVERAQWVGQPSGSFIKRAVGLHPQAIDELGTEETARAMDELASAADRLQAVAIGELGWDTKRAVASVERQSEIADACIELARAKSLPIIVHVVGAHAVALERLARHGRLSGVVHAYSGAAELVPRYLALGLALSFGPSVTRSRARKPLEAAIATPLDALLVETDGPDQFPEGRESRRGEPADVRDVVAAIAAARGEPFELVRARAYENARRLFG